MISIIAAIGKNYELGKDNHLIWHFKEDLQHFKNKTMGKYIVMGANTYASLPKRLEGRKYIVLSKKLKKIENGIVFHDLKKLLDFIYSKNEEIMIIGGASIYSLFIPYADKLYLTLIDESLEADVYFPEFDKTKYSYQVIKEDIDNNIKYKFVIYERSDKFEKW